MPIPAQRRLTFNDRRVFGSRQEILDVPDLTEIQTKSYERFLQLDVPAKERENIGLESVLRETFPIVSYNDIIKLEYIRYELGKPRYSPDECRQLRLTYGRPFRVWLRLVKDEPVEEEVYLGDIPIMIGGGEFIINGAERVVVSQLHRSPGVDFVYETDTSDRKSFACRIIPERGSWIEMHISRKDTLVVRIDQSGKFSAMTLLRAMSPEHSTNADILKEFYGVQQVKVSASGSELIGRIAAEDIIDPVDGEIYVDAAKRSPNKPRTTLPSANCVARMSCC